MKVKSSLYCPYEEKHGSIYFEGAIIEDLGFLLTIDKETGVATLYKHGDSSWLGAHMEKLRPLEQFMTPIAFSFGPYYESIYEKKEQIAIIAYMANYSASKITEKAGRALIEENFVSLKDAFDQMIIVMKRNGDFE